jgi:hypothetical protein
MGKRRYTVDEIDQMQPDLAKRFRELEAENARLKNAVAVLTVDTLILKEVAEENIRGSARKNSLRR